MTTTTAAGLQLVIRAIGTPVTQGSKSFKGMRRGRPVLLEDNDRELGRWRQAVMSAARSAMLAQGWYCLDAACSASIVWFLRRPPSVRRAFPDRQSDGDVDKYTRAVFDALTVAGVWADDSRCIDALVRKRYCGPGQPAGARITIRPVEEATG